MPTSMLTMASDSFVVDIQGFKTVNNTFVMKEVAIEGLRTRIRFHCIIKPPTFYPTVNKKQIQFVTKNIHGIKWHAGWLGYGKAVTTIREILANAKHIFIKGSERTKFLSNLLGNRGNVFDLDNIFDLKEKPLIDAEVYCGYKEHAHRWLGRCAFNKMITYRNWLL